MRVLAVLLIVAVNIIISTQGRVQPIRQWKNEGSRVNQSSPVLSEQVSQRDSPIEKHPYDEHSVEENSGTISRPFKNIKTYMVESNRIDEQNNQSSFRAPAACPDRDIARYLNYAISTYIHDMDGLSRYVLNQIIASRKPGKWLVHAQVISGSRQGRDWQTSTNSEIFSQKDQYACFYHDNLTYILVLRVY